ncbi:MAG: hypothetical protein J6F30_06055 [Cellulosilyticum sp.]|nr:hypothetical protein [Cellulosilyticum sp.]
MKKINSIHYGGKVIGIGCIFAFIIPLCIKLVNMIFPHAILSLFIMLSIGIGAIILLLFFIHLAIELRQDAKIDTYYSTHQNIKTPLHNGLYECASCGNRLVKHADTKCEICGVFFEDYQDKSPQEIIDTH